MSGRKIDDRLGGTDYEPRFQDHGHYPQEYSEESDCLPGWPRWWRIRLTYGTRCEHGRENRTVLFEAISENREHRLTRERCTDCRREYCEIVRVR